MRNRNLFRRIAFVAVMAGSFTVAGQTEAKNDFEALLADVDFGAAAAVEEAASSSASDVIGLSSEATELASTPAADVVEIPEVTAEPLPLPPASGPVADQPLAHQTPGTQCGGQCGGQCGSKCGHHCGLKGHDFIKEGFCQPYTPPQLPTSTFYQYWRSNACNVHVWDGFKNRCHQHIDLSIHPKQSCGCSSCASGPCNNIHPAGVVDCGPAPAEWCGKAACDTCDAK